jgi:rare lipoprotein A
MSFEFPPPGPHEKQGRAQLKTKNSKLKTAATAAGVVSLLLTVGCAHRGGAPVSTRPKPPAPPSAPVEEGWSEKGVASWYGEPYHGRRTASGEVYDMYAMTAAHKSLPFGTVVRVDRRDTGADVTVRINDRGPFIGGRIIDLSYASAQAIGLDVDGVAPVKITVVGSEAAPPSPPASSLPAEPESCFWVQVAAFGEVSNARRAQETLAAAGESAVVLEGIDALYRVRLGPFTDRKDAELARNRVTDAWPGSNLVPCGG